MQLSHVLRIKYRQKHALTITFWCCEYHISSTTHMHTHCICEQQKLVSSHGLTWNVARRAASQTQLSQVEIGVRPQISAPRVIPLDISSV